MDEPKVQNFLENLEQRYLLLYLMGIADTVSNASGKECKLELAHFKAYSIFHDGQEYLNKDFPSAQKILIGLAVSALRIKEKEKEKEKEEEKPEIETVGIFMT